MEYLEKRVKRKIEAWLRAEWKKYGSLTNQQIADGMNHVAASETGAMLEYAKNLNAAKRHRDASTLARAERAAQTANPLDGITLAQLQQAAMQIQHQQFTAGDWRIPDVWHP